MDAGGRATQEAKADDYMDVVGTPPGMEVIETHLERRSRATHDHMDVGGRATSGTVAEEAKAEGWGEGGE